MDMGRLGGSLTASVWFMDSDLVLFMSQRFVFWLVEAFGKSLQVFFASRMVRPKLVRSFIAHAQTLARCHANASSRAPDASRGNQGARARGHSGFEQVSFSWLSAERVGSSTLPGSRFTFHHDSRLHSCRSVGNWVGALRFFSGRGQLLFVRFFCVVRLVSGQSLAL